VFFVVLGGIGYRGLGYYRSELGRREYAGTLEREQRLESEGSAPVVLSAVVWALFLLLAQANGMTLTKGMLTTRDANADLARPAAPPLSSDAAQPVASDAEPPPMHLEDATAPDIAPIGLCRSGDSWLGVAFENRGSAATPGDFRITYGDSVWDPRRRSTFMTKLPLPGDVGLAALGSTGGMIGEDGMRNVIKPEFDSDNQIRESDERNNTPEYPIDWDIFAKLPECDSLRPPSRDSRRR
jgi:hypothetical protein